MAAQVRQLGNTFNAAIPAFGTAGTVAGPEDNLPAVQAEGDAPVRQINSATLQILGGRLKALFDKFAAERLPAEQRFLRNLRQRRGVYDPEVEKMLPPNRSRAYPRLTRMKCISMLSRIMNLMFPGNEDNWELSASPSPSMSPEMVAEAVSQLIEERKASGEASELTQELIDAAVRRLAEKQAAGVSLLIKDQLMELGGNQTVDWIALNRKVCQSGIDYGIGLLEGPFVRKVEESGWMLKAPGQGTEGGFQPVTRMIYKPQYDFLPVWDFYPDMGARTLPGEGYFVRKVLGRSALRKLADRKDFFERQIKEVLISVPGGNYKAKSWETELKGMGLSIQTQQNSTHTSGREKYEVIIWKGPISAQMLREAGAEVPDNHMADDIEAELWMIDNWVIKAEVNPWRKMGLQMQQVHIFNFDEDDTSPIGQGLPEIVRDSQLSVAAAARMTLDNASVVCGPNLEVNTALMRPDQDLTSVQPYKIWYRDDDGMTAQFPAVRRVEIEGHLSDLQGVMKTFLEFAEMETFIGPQTGGDMTKLPSEPMRTAAGASAVRGDAALPFKDIVRNYDSFTQSVIWSLVGFNKKFNPDLAPEGDYDVIPRGATSLIAKEVRGMQIDQLSATLTPDERDHVDDRKMIEAKFASRDLQGMLVSADIAKMRSASRAQLAAEDKKKQDELIAAQVRETLSSAFKNVSQGQKNAAAADNSSIDSVIKLSDTGKPDDQGNVGGAGKKAA